MAKKYLQKVAGLKDVRSIGSSTIEVLSGKALQIAKDSRNFHAKKEQISSGVSKLKSRFSKKRFQKTLNKERMKTWGSRAAVATPVALGGYYLNRKTTKNDK